MLSLSPGENPEIFTRAETPPAGRRRTGGSRSHPRRALRPLGLPRGAWGCTQCGCSGA